jgi:cupin 2 domain-containing protein
MTVRAGNLFADVAEASATSVGEEAFTEILARPGLKIERIISQGQISPPCFWYDQAWNEWVIVPLEAPCHIDRDTSPSVVSTVAA